MVALSEVRRRLELVDRLPSSWALHVGRSAERAARRPSAYLAEDRSDVAEPGCE